MESTTKPAYGTVDYYVSLLRHERNLPGLTLHFIDDLANDPTHEDSSVGGSRLDRIRNVLAAAEIVRAEVAGR